MNFFTPTFRVLLLYWFTKHPNFIKKVQIPRELILVDNCEPFTRKEEQGKEEAEELKKEKEKEKEKELTFLHFQM